MRLSLPALLLAAAVMLPLPVFAAPDYVKIAERARTEFVQPAYADLAKTAKDLIAAIDGDCAKGGAKGAASKPAFVGVMDAWQRAQPIRHGAVAMENRHSRLQFWPDKRHRTGKHLSQFLASGTPAALMPEAFADASVAVQGLSALERLLFDEPGLAPSPSKGEGVSRCALARAIAVNVGAVADAVAASWRQAPDGDGKARVGELFKDLTTEMQLVAEYKLALPAGSEDTPARPALAESWRAGRSLRNVELNLKAAKAVYEILAADATDDAQHKLIEHQFGEAFDMMKGWRPSLKQLLESPEGPLKARALGYVVTSLREIVIVKLMRDLDLKLGFNSLDGD